ncbi:MAG: hypothetical protein V9G16_14780, partial [Nitrosomonas sp.]
MLQWYSKRRKFYLNDDSGIPSNILFKWAVTGRTTMAKSAVKWSLLIWQGENSDKPVSDIGGVI